MVFLCVSFQVNSPSEQLKREMIYKSENGIWDWTLLCPLLDPINLNGFMGWWSDLFALFISAL